MEAELLRGMIADRDLRMEKIQRKSQEQAQRNIELCQRLEHVTEEVQQQSQKIALEKNQLVSQYQSVIHKLEQMQRDFKQQGASLKTYSKDASILGKVGANGSGGGDASYVMRMQAQLCKAMHSLGITDHQMELATKHTELIVKYQKETLIQCQEERTSTELKLMNQLIEKDNERRNIEESYQAKLDVIAKEREALERQMEESGHDLEDDDDDEDNNADEDEEDAEEKEMKQEMMQLLTERRAEIKRFENIIEEQEDLIAELEEQVADIVNSLNVPQRKSQESNNVLSTETMKTNNTANNNENEDDDEDVDEEDGEDDEALLQDSTTISTVQAADVVQQVTDNEADDSNNCNENIALENVDKTNDSTETEAVADEVEEEEDVDNDDPTQQDTSAKKNSEEIPIT
jgi:hypothetical protein